jgi:hypothetical protein
MMANTSFWFIPVSTVITFADVVTLPFAEQPAIVSNSASTITT